MWTYDELNQPLPNKCQRARCRCCENAQFYRELFVFTWHQFVRCSQLYHEMKMRLR